jgi:hypothetical protein
LPSSRLIFFADGLTGFIPRETSFRTLDTNAQRNKFFVCYAGITFADFGRITPTGSLSPKFKVCSTKGKYGTARCNFGVESAASAW